MRLRHRPPAAGPIARKAAPGARPRAMDRSLERQAEEATQAALHGQVNVSRVLTPAPTARAELPASTGRPLPVAFRRAAERAFGADFAAVRVHTDADAATAAAREDAHAFTAGRSIFFAEGQYDPGSDAGRTLLYHELAHVLQQTGRRVSATDIRATDRQGAGPSQKDKPRG
jgi:hypothetical protein